MHARPDTFTLEELLAHERWAERLALALVGDPAAARDVLQETWIAALERPPRRDRPARGWLATVLKNFAAQRRRGELRRRRREQEAARTEALPPSDELAQRLDGQRLLTERVMTLPQALRDTVVLHYYEGLSLVEIARRGDEPAVTVRGRLRRALHLLREGFHGREDGDRGGGLLALAPLVRRATESASEGTVASTALKSPVLLLVLTAGLGTVAVFEWRIGLRDSAPEPVLSSSAEPIARERPVDEGQLDSHTGSPFGQPVEPTRRTASVREPDSAETLATAPRTGWWLMGAVPKWETDSAAPATLTIRRERGIDAGAIRVVLTPDGRVRVDLETLFTDGLFLPRRLHVTLTHPALLDHEQTLEVSRDERQSGFLADGIATWTLDETWTVARAAALGVVRVAPEAGARRVIVALFACDERGAPTAPPVGTRTLALDEAATGSFRLPAAGPGTYLVVAAAVDENLPAAHAGAQPATRRIVVDGEARLSDPIDLVPGAWLDGRLECAGAVGARCRLRFEPAGRSARSAIVLASGIELSWNGTRFVHGAVEVTTDDTGRFAVGAFEPGAVEVRLLGPTRASGSVVPTIRVDVDPPVLRALVPGAGVILGFDVGCTLLHVTRDGRPVFGAGVPGHSGGHSRADGLLGVLRPAARALELRLREPENGATVVRLAPPGQEAGRVPVELPGRVSPARLEFDVLGDPERWIEVLTFELYRAAEPGVLVARRRERRLAGPLVLASLPPGRYVVHARPAVHGTGDALAGTFMPCTFEVELPAAATVRRSLVFERGGCLRIHSGTLSAPGERLSFRVLDAGGAERRVRFVTDDEPDTYGFLPVDRDVRTAPALPAGLYELEVWDDAGVRRRLPFELRAGAETALSPR